MNLSLPTPENLFRAAEILKSGGIVAIPTETVYGLAADALNPLACAKIFEAKRRPFFDPLICHVSSLEMVSLLSGDLPPVALRLAEAFWPGPLTLVLDKKEIVPEIVTSGLPTVAVRFPNHKTALEIIRLSGTPLAAPSANPFGYLSPTDASHVLESLGSRVDMIIDGGRCSVGVESTIVRVEDDDVFVLRPGGIATSDIEKVSGRKSLEYSGRVKAAPGMTESHYAPKSRLVIIDEGAPVEDESAPVMSFRGKRVYPDMKILSPSGDILEAAANLFSTLHELDSKGHPVIYAEAVPCESLGEAIMNRLKKAAAQREAGHFN